MTLEFVPKVFRSRMTIDAALTVAVALVAYRVAYASLSTFAVAPWVEDLLVPCTGRPGWVPDPEALKMLPQWQAFMAGKLQYFPCQALAGLPLVEVGASWRQLEYFHRSLGLWFQLVGPKLDGFASFQAAFHAATCAVAYLIFRLGLWRIVALGCTAGIVWSSWHLTAVAMPIEYAKAPWMLAAVGLCGLILRRDALARSIWLPAFALGLVAGIGIGFKSDLIAAVPLAVITTTIFVGRTPGSQSRRVKATLCVLAGVALGGGAVLYRTLGGDAGSVLAVQVLGGLDWVTEGTYAVSPVYDYGLAFDDSHITVVINSYAHRVMGATAQSHFYSQAMQQASAQLLRDYWATFPGDLVLRVVAATLRVLQLNGYGLVLALAGLFVIFVKDVRTGWFVAMATVYLSAYVSLVFQRRHFYHLEFISWGLAGVLVQGLCWPRGVIPDRAGYAGASGRLVTASLSLGSIALTAITLLAIARAVQQGAVLRLIENHLQAPREERQWSRHVAQAGEVLVRVEGISAVDGQAAWPVDRMTWDYAVLTFGCPDATPISVRVTYHPPAAAWNRRVSVPCESKADESIVMVPIYQYGLVYRFDGIIMSDQAAERLHSVEVMRADPQVKLWLPLQLPADWRSKPLHKVMRRPLETP